MIKISGKKVSRIYFFGARAYRYDLKGTKTIDCQMLFETFFTKNQQLPLHLFIKAKYPMLFKTNCSFIR